MRRHKRSHGGGSPGINLGLIITPMLDMAFQILAFFIMTYPPSALEGHVPGLLDPPEDYAKKSTKESTPSNEPEFSDPSLSIDDPVPDTNDSVRVKVKAIVRGQESGEETQGKPNQLWFKLPKASLDAKEKDWEILMDVNGKFDDGLKELDGRLRTLAKAELVKDADNETQREAKFKELLKKGASSKVKLKIVADNDLHQQYVMRVYDTCKKAGFSTISFVPPPLLTTKFNK